MITNEASIDRQARTGDRSSDLLVQYGIDEEDLQRIRRYGAMVSSRLDLYVEKFYSWLEKQPEFARFFADKMRLERVKQLQSAYWLEFFRGTVDDHYVAQRELVGNVHARIGLQERAESHRAPRDQRACDLAPGRRDHADRCGHLVAERVAEHHEPLADLKVVGVAHRERLQPRLVDR